MTTFQIVVLFFYVFQDGLRITGIKKSFNLQNREYDKKLYNSVRLINTSGETLWEKLAMEWAIVP